MYPWPTGDFDNVMDVALDIAMNYLDLTGQAVMYEEVRSTAAKAITAAAPHSARPHRNQGGRTQTGTVFEMSKARLTMEYRGVEYTVVQGIERGVWKWSVSLGEPKIIKVGQAKTKLDAVVAVEHAIDKVLALKKMPIVLPRPSD